MVKGPGASNRDCLGMKMEYQVYIKLAGLDVKGPLYPVCGTPVGAYLLGGEGQKAFPPLRNNIYVSNYEPRPPNAV